MQDLNTVLEVEKPQIVISHNLKTFIQPLSKDEFEQLERNILTEGCRDAIVLWKTDWFSHSKEEFVLIDGHNRYEICQKHQIDFKYIVKEFADLDEVKAWMVYNQLGRRNATPELTSFLRGQEYILLKKDKSKNLYLPSVQNEHSEENKSEDSEKTSEKLAEKHKVSPMTIRRDAKYTALIEELCDGDNELKWKILNKDIDIPKAQLVEYQKYTTDLISANLKLKNDWTWGKIYGDFQENIAYIKKEKLKSPIYMSIDTQKVLGDSNPSKKNKPQIVETKPIENEVLAEVLFEESPIKQTLEVEPVAEPKFLGAFIDESTEIEPITEAEEDEIKKFIAWKQQESQGNFIVTLIDFDCPECQHKAEAKAQFINVEIEELQRIHQENLELKAGIENLIVEATKIENQNKELNERINITQETLDNYEATIKDYKITVDALEKTNVYKTNLNEMLTEEIEALKTGKIDDLPELKAGQVIIRITEYQKLAKVYANIYRLKGTNIEFFYTESNQFELSQTFESIKKAKAQFDYLKSMGDNFCVEG